MDEAAECFVLVCQLTRAAQERSNASVGLEIAQDCVFQRLCFFMIENENKYGIVLFYFM